MASIGRVMLRHVALLLVAYAFGILAVFLFVVQPDLVDVVAACKIVSLFILIYANREIPHAIELERQQDLARINQAIVVMSSVILILLSVKTVVQDYSLLALPPTGQQVIAFFSYNSYWIATLPVFVYGLLNLHIAFLRNSSDVERRIALEFVLFRDLVCAVPLALVLLLTEVYRLFSTKPDAALYAELFFSGAIAVILLSSAIATRSLDVLQKRKRGPVLLTREAWA
jgi:hypothetical protein